MGFGAALLILAACGPAHAIRVSPMTRDLEPSGQASVTTINVQNTGDTPLTYEVTVFRRTIAVHGYDVHTPADDDFMVFPPQGIVRPGATQALRVRYVGPPDLDQSRNYVIMVSQLPVNLTSAEQSGVRFVFSFGVSVSVIPRGARPDLRVLAVTPQGGDTVRVRLRNDGRAVTRLGEWIWRFQVASGADVELSGDALRSQIAQPLILPGTERIVDLRVPGGIGRSGEVLLRLRHPRL
jgi:fimbrial chaperone protein